MRDCENLTSGGREEDLQWNLKKVNQGFNQQTETKPPSPLSDIELNPTQRKNAHFY